MTTRNLPQPLAFFAFPALGMGILEKGGPVELVRATVGVRNQQYLHPRIPTAVAKLLRYRSSMVELRDGFSSHK